MSYNSIYSKDVNEKLQKFDELPDFDELEGKDSGWQPTHKRLVIAGNQRKVQEFTQPIWHGGKRPKRVKPPEPSRPEPPEPSDDKEVESYTDWNTQPETPKGWGRTQEASEENQIKNKLKVASRDRELVWRYANANPDLNRFLTLTHDENIDDLSAANKDLTNFWKRLEREGNTFFKHYVITGKIRFEINGEWYEPERFLSRDKVRGLDWKVSGEQTLRFQTVKEAREFLTKQKKAGLLPDCLSYAITESLPFDLKYLAVPEFQERGAIHYHCLVNLPFMPQVHAIVADVPKEDGETCLHYLSKTGTFTKTANKESVYFESDHDAKEFVKANQSTYETGNVTRFRTKRILLIQVIWGKGHADIRTVQNLQKSKGMKDVGDYMTKYMCKAVYDVRYKGKKKVFHSHNLEKPEIILDEYQVDLELEALEKEKTFDRSYTFENEWLGFVTVSLYNLLYLWYPWLKSRRDKLKKAWEKRKERNQFDRDENLRLELQSLFAFEELQSVMS